MKNHELKSSLKKKAKKSHEDDEDFDVVAEVGGKYKSKSAVISVHPTWLYHL